jgi:hypothetical protein
MIMNVSIFKKSVRARDLQLIAVGYKQMRYSFTDSEVFRIALAADPDLRRPIWDDILKEAGVVVSKP